jgi:hypothetical protein
LPGQGRHIPVNGSRGERWPAQCQPLNELQQVLGKAVAPMIPPLFANQSCQPVTAVGCHPTLCGSERNTLRSCQLSQENVTVQMRLEETEPLQGSCSVLVAEVGERCYFSYFL